MRYARIENGRVAEIVLLPVGVTIEQAFPATLVFVACSDETVEDGWTYDDATFTAPKLPEITPDDLLAFAAQKRWQVETGGIVVGGAQIATDRESQAMIGNAVQVTSLTGQTIKFKSESGFIELTPEQMQGVALAVAAHVQACLAVEADVVAKIEAGTITNVEQIDTYAWPSGDAA